MAKQNPARVNINPETENAINQLINTHLSIAYIYTNLSAFMWRDDVALSGFADYWRLCCQRQEFGARQWIRQLTLRGSRFVPMEVKPFSQQTEWANALEAVKFALDMEKKVDEKLRQVHKLAQQHQDPEITDFLETKFLHNQVKCIKKLSNHQTNLMRAGPGGLTDYLYDKMTIRPSVQKMVLKMVKRASVGGDIVNKMWLVNVLYDIENLPTIAQSGLPLSVLGCQ